ncbi:hypothetical protein RQP46_001893 [Phenoliferia psychrophenolica]
MAPYVTQKKSTNSNKNRYTPKKWARREKERKTRQARANSPSSSGAGSSAAATAERSDTDSDSDEETESEGEYDSLETIEERVAVESSESEVEDELLEVIAEYIAVNAPELPESPEPPNPLYIPGDGRLATHFFRDLPELLFHVFQIAAGQAVLDRNLDEDDIVAANWIELREYSRLSAITRTTVDLAAKCMASRIVLGGDFSLERQLAIGAWAQQRNHRSHEVRSFCRGELPEGGNVLDGLQLLRDVAKFVFSCERLKSQRAQSYELFPTKALLDLPLSKKATLIVVPFRHTQMRDSSPSDRPKWTVEHLNWGSRHHLQLTPNFLSTTIYVSRKDLRSLHLNSDNPYSADFNTVALALPAVEALREVAFLCEVGRATFDALSVMKSLEEFTSHGILYSTDMDALTGAPDAGRFANLKILRLPIYHEFSMASPGRDNTDDAEAILILKRLQVCLEMRGKCGRPTLGSLQRIEFVGDAPGAQADNVDLDVVGRGLKAICDKLGIYIGPRL